ncbi:MAG TPA: alpha/beta hydrolase [Streptosporangiaceae bacterium]|jgi:pimeloyl-ACP methyl ester carboxylesterase|nr:alpha/beta hydrolase [Streptosporangiaceae bacterium]
MLAAAATAAASAVMLVTLSAAPGHADPAVASAAALTGYSSTPVSYKVKLKWASCGATAPAPFQCATAPAPLDYRHPAGQRIQLALIRLPAANPKQRIGSLFINFGGPGGSGVSLLPQRATTVFSAAIRNHFDLVSWDTRAVGRSTAVRCFPSQAASNAYFASVPYFPYPQSQDRSFWTLSAQLGRDCEQRAGTLLPHMSSQDTARDLDLLRQDVGDAKLNYMGFSYGTVIGAIYANLFPRNIRAMVLDGTLDFVANATGNRPGDARKYPVDVRGGVDVAGQDVLNRFFSLCAAAAGKCAFSSGGNLPGKWAALLARSKTKPITVNGGTYFYSTIVAITYYNLYKPMTAWPALGTLLQQLYQASSGQPAAMTPAVSRQMAQARATAQQEYLDNAQEAYYAIQCADIEAPTAESVYDNLANIENQKVPGFGRFVTYDMAACGTWPALHTDAYDGPWNRSLATILVINSRHDPATPYQGAVAGTRELGNARLLTVNGDGHTSEYSEPSACRDTAKQAYLISLKLPARGTVCPVDQLPWGVRASS